MTCTVCKKNAKCEVCRAMGYNVQHLLSLSDVSRVSIARSICSLLLPLSRSLSLSRFLSILLHCAVHSTLPSHSEIERCAARAHISCCTALYTLPSHSEIERCAARAHTCAAQRSPTSFHAAPIRTHQTSPSTLYPCSHMCSVHKSCMQCLFIMRLGTMVRSATPPEERKLRRAIPRAHLSGEPSP